MPRKSFDGGKLANDVTQLRAADAASPPAARPSLMDAVRAFASFVNVRAELGWTDAMIATVLTEAGYAIDAATLRSYRKRLRDEGVLPAVPPTPGRTPLKAGASRPSVPRQLPPTASSDPADTSAGPTEAASVKPEIDAGAPRAPPDAKPAPRRTFGINKATLPPEQA